MPHIDLPDVSLHYQLSGPPDAPVLLLSNSLGTSLDMWKPQTAPFAHLYRVLRYDMRGHGRSSTPPGPYTLDKLGRDVVSLLDTLGFDQVDFCGLSLGGVIGQWLGVNVPARLKHLMLCNTAAKIGTEATWNSRIEAVQTGGTAAIADAVIERWFTPAYRAAQPAIVAEMRTMLAASDPAGYAAACAAIRDMDQRATAASIASPTLLIAGEYDPVTTVSDAEFLQARIPDARLVVLPAAHISNVEASEQFNAAVLNFLAESPHD